MKKKNKKVINRAKNIITKYKDDKSVYYTELTKAFNDYKNIDNLDKTTQELYIEHINRLCDFIVQKRYAHIIIAVTILLFGFVLSFAIYSTNRYIKISNDIKNNIINATMDASIVVEYKNLNNFNATLLSYEEEYKELTPLSLTVSAVSKKNELYNVKYDIYLIEENDNIASKDLLDRNVFLYNIETSKEFDGIKSLKYSKIDKNKVHLYSGEFLSTEIEEVNVRMWIDKNTDIDYLNKQYRFKLYVSGYVEKY